MSERISQFLVALLFAVALVITLQLFNVAMWDGLAGNWAGDATL